MKQSVDRILTTHTGSLPRGCELTALYADRQKGGVVDEAEITRMGREAVRKVVSKQAAAGIDIGNDGEQMKDSFFLYLAQRLTGFGGSWQRPPRSDVERYPEFKRMLAEQAAKVAVNSRAGVIDMLTNIIEHPEAVADRLQRVAEAVGDPRRVQGGTDCGFDTGAGAGRVAEDIVWAKLKALSDGARIASRRLSAAWSSVAEA
jgi:methionine synthase II (cobalamin-independent)